MQPAEDFAPATLIGKRVAFKDGEEHAHCWHRKVGLKTGVVLKVGQTLAQKAQLMGLQGEAAEEFLSEEADIPKLWVRADPSPSFPRGCETAVEQACLLVVSQAQR
jgi:hypothetical protein